MCRNIRTLFNFDPPVTEQEVRASALQYVKKISGFTEPSKVNETGIAMWQQARLRNLLVRSPIRKRVPYDLPVDLWQQG